MGTLANEEIIRALETDKTRGIRLLFERYYHPLVIYGNRILYDRNKAEDTVQEVFVRLWEDNYLRKITASNLASYLFTAVRNTCITHNTRKDILRHPVELSDIDIPVEAFTSVDEERVERVMREIAQLPPRTRQVVECIMLKGLKYKETATELNISVNTVKFLLKEGTQKLRTKLSNEIFQIFFTFLRKKYVEKAGKGETV